MDFPRNIQLVVKLLLFLKVSVSECQKRSLGKSINFCYLFFLYAFIKYYVKYFVNENIIVCLCPFHWFIVIFPVDKCQMVLETRQISIQFAAVIIISDN